MRKGLLAILFIAAILKAMAQETIPLYEGKIPNSKPHADRETRKETPEFTIISKISRPTISIFLPKTEKPNGTAIIIFPGGGYTDNAVGHEGTDVAKRFNEMGITAFVIKYRIPDDSTMVDKEIGPLQDAQRAIQLVRLRAREWSLDIHRIGVMGFSAGGHLAATAGTHFGKAVIDNPQQISLRPDFMILGYPVISFQDDIAHMGSRQNLIGKTPSREKIDFYSAELQVNAETPPCFLFHAEDDDVVPVQNSIRFYDAMVKYKVPGELHLYERGGHGFGMHNKMTKEDWVLTCQRWLQTHQWD